MTVLARFVCGVVMAAPLAACSFFMPADNLRPRAAYDLHCPSEQLKVTELSGDCGKKLGNTYNCTLGVEGCGHQATYVHIPDGDWVMNNTLEKGTASAQ